MSQPVSNLLVNGLNPTTISTTSTSVQYFPFVPGASIGATATTPVAGFIAVPGASRSNGQQMSVRAVGNFTPGVDTTSPTVGIGLYYITKTIQAAALTDISQVFKVTVAAAGLGIVASPWRFVCDMNCDTASGILQGNYTLQADNEAISTGVIGAISGIDMSKDQPLAFCVGITFSQDGTHTNKASMYQFDIQF